MLQCKIICAGKLKEKYYAEAAKEYLKRLSRFCKVEIIEVPDEKIMDNFSNAQIDAAVKREGERMLARIADERVIALCIEGSEYSSLDWAEKLKGYMVTGISRITFVIGGSHGISDNVLSRADEKLSFSKFTFCHQLMRVILLEQIYRAMKILSNESYHK